MKVWRSFAVIATVAVLVPASAHAAETKDPFCPAASDQIVRLGNVKGSDAKAVVDATGGVVAAYRSCKLELESSGGRFSIEPKGHYATVRAAQFGVVLGRALAAQGRKADALAAFREARKDAASVAEWRYDPTAYINGTVGGDIRPKGPSVYRDQAEAVVTAADAEIAKLDGTAPAATPSPAPSATP